MSSYTAQDIQAIEAIGAVALRNVPTPRPVAPKRAVKVGTNACKMQLELYAMRLALHPVRDRELRTLIATAEAALQQVQYAAGSATVLVRAA